MRPVSRPPFQGTKICLGFQGAVDTFQRGQSGDPDSPHYCDLFEPWAKGRYFPVSFSRTKVETVAESKMILSP